MFNKNLKNLVNQFFTCFWSCCSYMMRVSRKEWRKEAAVNQR